MRMIIRFLKAVYWGIYNCIPIHGNHNIVVGHCRRKKIVGDNNKIVIGKDCSVDCTITIYGSGNVVKIGDGVVFKSGSIWVEDDNNIIEIGSQSTIENAEIAVAEGTSIRIGDDCMISTGVRIASSDAHSIVKHNPQGERLNPAKNIQVENHVWIGLRATVCKGVIIGHDSIIGTQSVVTHSVESNTVVAGNPATKIKEHVSWLRERI